jgi:WD40 repeat protein
MTGSVKLAERVGRVHINGERIGGRVSFSRSGDRVVEIRARCHENFSAGQACVYDSASGECLLQIEKENERGLPTFIWANEDLSALAIACMGETLELVDVESSEARIVTLGGEQWPCSTSFVCFSPCGRYYFETNSYYERGFGESEAAAVAGTDGRLLLLYPKVDMSHPWPSQQRYGILSDSDSDRPGFPPIGMKFDPVWSRDGETGAATIERWFHEGNGVSLLPGVSHQAGVEELSEEERSCIAFVWKNPGKVRQYNEDDNVSIYLPPYALAVTHLDFGRSGDVFLSLSQDGACRIHRTDDGSCLREYAVLGQLETGFLSPDGRFIIAVCADNTVSIITVESAELTARFSVTCRPSKQSVSSCGEYIVSALPSGYAALISLETGTAVRQFNADIGDLASLSFAPDTRHLIACGRDEWALIDAAMSATAPKRPGRVLALTDDRNTICVQDGDFFRVLDLVSDREKWSVRRVMSAAHFLSGAQIVMSMAEDCGERLHFDAVSGLPIGAHELGSEGNGFEVLCRETKAGCRLSVRVFSYTGTGEQADVVPIGRGPDDVSASVWVELFADGSRKAFRHWHHDGGLVTAKTFDPDARSLIVAVVDDYVEDGARTWLERIDTSDGSILKMATFRNPSVVTADMSHDGGLVLTVDDQTSLRIWRSDTGRVQACLPATEDRDRVWSARISPSGDCLFAIYQSGTARAWGERTNGRIICLETQDRAVMAGCFSPDGELLLASLSDGSALVFEAVSGRCLAEIRSAEGRLESCGFSLDGKRILTFSGTAIETWDAGFSFEASVG